MHTVNMFHIMIHTEKMLRDDALKGKTVVVTGGGSGLGKAMTRYFLELGAQVAISSRNLEKLRGWVILPTPTWTRVEIFNQFVHRLLKIVHNIWLFQVNFHMN